MRLKYLILVCSLYSLGALAAENPAGQAFGTPNFRLTVATSNSPTRGQTWVSGLRVRTSSNGEQLASDGPGTKLTLARGAKPGETLVRVTGPKTLELVLEAENSRVLLSLRGLKSQQDATVEGEVRAGSSRCKFASTTWKTT